MTNAIRDRVKSIVAERLCLNAENIADDARIREDLNADSLDSAEIIISIDSEFGFETSDSEINDIRTIGDIFALVSKKRSELACDDR